MKIRENKRKYSEKQNLLSSTLIYIWLKLQSLSYLLQCRREPNCLEKSVRLEDSRLDLFLFSFLIVFYFLDLELEVSVILYMTVTNLSHVTQKDIDITT